MTKPKKKRKNKYQASIFGQIRGIFFAFRGFLAVFVMFCFIVLLGSALSRLYHRLVYAPWFRLEKIEITGAKKLDRSRILDAVGLKRGQCTLSINTEQVSESLRKLAEVKEVEVGLQLRGCLNLTVVEREPAAVVNCGELNMLMDLDGVLFAEATPDEKGALPYITGLCSPGSSKGDSVTARNLAQIKGVLSAMGNSRSWLSASTVSECRWDENGFTIIMGERAVPISIGQDGFEQKFTKLRRVISTLNGHGLTDSVTGIDLDYPGKAFLEGQFPIHRPVQGLSKQPG
jgi:cell division septal protein FtsQ